MFREVDGNRDILETRSGGGAAMILAVPVLGVAILCFGLLAGQVPGMALPVPWPAVLLCGVAFGVTGAWLLVYRQGIVLDRRRRSIVVWWGLPTAVRETARPWTEFATVTITAEVHHSKNSTYTVYPVRVIGQGKPLMLMPSREYLPARQIAEQVAEFMGLPLHDSSSGVTVVREPGELNESLADRLRRTGTPAPLPTSLAATRAKIFRKDRSFMFEFPTPLNVPLLVALAGGTVVTVLAVLVASPGLFLGFGLPRPAVVALMLLVLVGPEVAVGVYLVFGRRQPLRVIVAPTSLRVETRAGWRAKITEIPADKLEELEVLSGATLPPETAQLPPQARRAIQLFLANAARSIMARSDTQTIEFGQMLSDAEKQYLAAVIRHVLVS